jgi:hypothetical protein
MATHYYKLKHGKDYTTFCGGGWRDQMRKDIFLGTEPQRIAVLQPRIEQILRYGMD